jgi:hypothetical protein
MNHVQLERFCRDMGYLDILIWEQRLRGNISEYHYRKIYAQWKKIYDETE